MAAGLRKPPAIHRNIEHYRRETVKIYARLAPGDQGRGGARRAGNQARDEKDRGMRGDPAKINGSRARMVRYADNTRTARARQ